MKIEGFFYFKLTKNGNLLGEFTNNGMHNRWDIESSNYHHIGIKGNFECTYLTTWLEDEKSFKSFLKIDKIDKINYSLIWRNFDGKEIFFGKAKLKNKILLGTYTNQK